MRWCSALWSHRFVCCLSIEFQLFLPAFHVDDLAFMKFAAQYLDRQRILQFALNGPFERAGAVIGIIANLGEVGARLRADANGWVQPPDAGNPETGSGQSGWLPGIFVCTCLDSQKFPNIILEILVRSK